MKKQNSGHKNLIPEKYKYTDEVPLLLMDFFDRELFTEVNGKTYPSPLPTIEGFCKTLYISKRTFHNWLEREPILKEAYYVAKNFQHDQLLYLTLIGVYKEGVAKMLMQNLTGLRSEAQLIRDEETQGAKDKKELTLNYSVNQIPEKT